MVKKGQVTTLHIYLVSDSSGETVAAVSRAAVTQFTGLHVIEYMWPLVRSKEQIDALMIEVQKAPGVIIHTMVNSEVRTYLIDKCKAISAPCLCSIQSILDGIQDYLKVPPSKQTPGKYSKLDDDYFSKIESMNFAINHDDGAGMEEYNKADIVLLGVSRTSKSPTALYLSQRGYKVANFPIVLDISTGLKISPHPLVVGFTIEPQYLLKVRCNRFASYKDMKNNSHKFLENYLSIDAINQEVEYAIKLFEKLKISVINVTAKAIEEIAAEVINLFFIKRGAHRCSDFMI
ncbi:Kinase/pyrophosphorylase [Alphaproteobacteria bacterium]